MHETVNASLNKQNVQLPTDDAHARERKAHVRCLLCSWMAVRLMCHKNRTPNPCSERTDSNMGWRHRKAGNTNREHSGCTELFVG